LIDTLTLRRKLISLAIFNTIFEKLAVAYFLGHPVVANCVELFVTATLLFSSVICTTLKGQPVSE